MGGHDAENDVRTVQSGAETAGYLDRRWHLEVRQVYVVHPRFDDPGSQVRLIDPKSDPIEAWREDNRERGPPTSTHDNGECSQRLRAPNEKTFSVPARSLAMLDRCL